MAKEVIYMDYLEKHQRVSINDLSLERRIELGGILGKLDKPKGWAILALNHDSKENWEEKGFGLLFTKDFQELIDSELNFLKKIRDEDIDPSLRDYSQVDRRSPLPKSKYLYMTDQELEKYHIAYSQEVFEHVYTRAKQQKSTLGAHCIPRNKEEAIKLGGQFYAFCKGVSKQGEMILEKLLEKPMLDFMPYEKFTLTMGLRWLSLSV